MRVLLRMLSPLLGLAVAALGTLLVVEVVAAWLGATSGGAGLLMPWPGWRTTLEQVTWRDTWVLVGAGLTTLVGLLLLLMAGSARRHDIRLEAPAPEITVTTSPRVLARLVGRTVRSTDRITGASVKASARAVRVTVTARGEQPGELRPSVRTRVGELLDELPLARRPKVSVSVRSERGPR